jgi:NADPH:quinone reductase-like Zn-dependent oxidoreductase
MKAAIRRNYCNPEKIKIEEIKTPSPKSNEVLVKVHATTINRTDCANLTAKPFIMRFVLGFLKPKKIILGTDFAGMVSKVGIDVTSIKEGDKVFGFFDAGLESQAEFLITKPGNLYPIPNEVDFKSAAASIEGAHYAYTFMHKVNLKPGDKVLINGATGGIGSALLQFVKTFDVEITATSNSKNMDLIKSLGANHVIDYTKEDFTKTSNQYNYIFDAVGKSTFGKCRPILIDGGVYISSELGPYAQNLFFAISTSIFGTKKVVFPVPYSPKETIPYIIKMLQSKKYNPVIDKTYSLNEISEAYNFVIKGQKTGNVILEF